MSIFGIGEKILETLAKQGKAILVFTVEKHPGDQLFNEASPSIDLYIVPRKKDEKEPPEKLLDEYFKGTISSNTDLSNRSFVEEVESIYGYIDRMWNKKKTNLRRYGLWQNLLRCGSNDTNG